MRSPRSSLASSAKVLSRNSAWKVASAARVERTIPCSSTATRIGTPVASRTLIGSCRIGQPKRFH
jgi:hypothetical protein